MINKGEEQRAHLIMKLRGQGIRSASVLSAIESVPRDIFIENALKYHAWENVTLPIGEGQTISQPYIVALMTTSLNLSGKEIVLEIGTGSGYQTAVLCLLEAEVYSIERQLELFKKTSLFLPKIGHVAKRLIFGDGYLGLKEEAPFDRILVTAGAPFVPKPLLAQLKIGGRLVIPVGEEEQVMTLYIRSGQKNFEKHEFGNFKFVPMLEDKS